MSAKDLQRIEVLTEVLAGRRSEVSAAAVLAISDRQLNRCWSDIGMAELIS